MMAESAAYFEERNMPAQAVELYQKALSGQHLQPSPWP